MKRAWKRRSCSARLTENQYLNKRLPLWLNILSNSWAVLISCLSYNNLTNRGGFFWPDGSVGEALKLAEKMGRRRRLGVGEQAGLGLGAPVGGPQPVEILPPVVFGGVHGDAGGDAGANDPPITDESADRSPRVGGGGDRVRVGAGGLKKGRPRGGGGKVGMVAARDPREGGEERLEKGLPAGRSLI